jgi:secreted trypsin-like serine protease
LVYICGGTIINKNYVLTAAHCVYESKPEDLSVVYGTINYSNGPRVYVKQINSHNFGFNTNTTENDLALLELTHPLVFDEYTKAISLRETQVPVGTTITISGFGIPSTGELRYIETKVIECQQKFKGVICLKKDELHGSCSGDSGGPAIYENELIGVSSFGVPDCNKTHSANYDGYTNVSYFYEWITDKMLSNKLE